ncbi:MAG TPA: CvpA family protein [Terriglobales bacterium]|jgi:membrane protein required for colicin V production|nr:CvpA family protein [Terriglobales bacterium]
MTAADWIIVVVVLLSVIQAAISGFFHEAFGIAGLILGYLLAAWNYQRLAARYAPYLKSMWLGEIGAFLVIFLAVLIIAGIAGRITRHIVKEAGLSFVDRILGGALGLLRGILMVAVILMSMAAFTPTSTWLEGSEFAPYFLVVGRAAIWVAPPELRSRFYQGLDLLHREQQHK